MCILRKVISGVIHSENTTNLLHLGEMQRSVASNIPTMIFASRRDATISDGNVTKVCGFDI